MFAAKEEKEKKEKDKEKEKKEKKERKLQRSSTVAAPERAVAEKKAKARSANSGDKEAKSRPAKAKASGSGKTERKGSLKRKNKVKREVKVDVSKPIDYPCVPEILLEYQKAKPFLKPNEEWLLVELAEFECLIESVEILQIMAKHSKFFELDPPEMVEEFFEFVDDVPSYDEVINYDVWQEFRDKRYPC